MVDENTGNDVVEPQPGQPAEPELTEEQVKAQLEKLIGAGKWAEAKPFLTQLSKIEKDREKVAKDALQAKLAGLTDKVMKVIDKAVQPLIDSKELDGADGIWFANDFGEKLSTCRIVKTQRKAATGTGSSTSSYVTGFPPSDEMLKVVGNQPMFDKDTEVTIDKQTQIFPAGTTFEQAYAFSTNGGWRNRVRMALGKAYTKTA